MIDESGEHFLMADETISANRASDDAVGVRQELEAAYQRAGVAWKAKDAETLMQMVTPGFTQEMPDGQVIDAAEAEAGLREWFATADTVSHYDVRIDALDLGSGEAIAEVAETVSMTFPGPDGRQHERAQANTARVTWVRTEQGWRIGRSEYLTGKMSIDGMPVEA
jgi:ketosteroid isomerase-like protein